MSTNEPFFSKENWQNNMNPGPSNHVDLGLPTAHKFRQTSTGRTMKQTWICEVCRKELSSKRSYTEHMNIHNKSRPFQCEHCTYAAASQMTLHRHKLRNHTPKTEWGYRCPYCEDAFMEPAGYQQHVQQRHPGKSCTYGCPFQICKFVSKSQRHFREHLVKHDRSDKLDGTVDPCALNNQQLVRYMVNDEIGQGFQRPAPVPSGSTQPITIRARKQVTIAPNSYSTESGMVEMKPQISWHLESVIPNNTIIRTNEITSRPVTKTVQARRYYMPANSNGVYCGSGSQKFQQFHMHPEELQYGTTVIMDEEEYEEELSGQDELDEEEDDPPPILESYGNPNHTNAREQPIDAAFSELVVEDEPPNKEGSNLLPGGLMDYDLD
ncbi:unnamed protein product [Caenorhabditis brenneri]